MRRTLAILGVTIATLLVFCRDPTQITVEIHTDVPCSDLRRVTLTVGGANDYESKAPVTVTADCDASGRVGTLVVVPSGRDTDELAIKVVAGVGADAESCKAPDYGPNCIVARRLLRYLPQTSVTLPIWLRRSCTGIPCTPTSTCVDDRCNPAKIDNPEQCVTPEGCEPKPAPPDAAPPLADASRPDTAPPPDAAPPDPVGFYKKSSPALPFVSACDLPGMTRYVRNADDEVSPQVAVPAGFAFSFSGQPVQSYWVSDNAVLGFGTPASQSRFHCLPAPGNPRPAIFAFSDDLTTRSGGVCVGVQGNAPNRQLVATWDNATLYQLNTQLTFSVILNETTNVVDIVYQTMSGDPDATGTLAVVGLQNADGTQATMQGCRMPGIVQSGGALRFTP